MIPEEYRTPNPNVGMRRGVMAFEEGAWTISVNGAIVHGPASATSCGDYCREHRITLELTHDDRAYQAIDVEQWRNRRPPKK